MAESEEEKYQEWLERLDIPVESKADIETFKDYLRDELGITGDKQIEALWGATREALTMEDYGIRAVIITYPWGRELRYGVQGIPGLWGWESILEIMAGEGW